MQSHFFCTHCVLQTLRGLVGMGWLWDRLFQSVWYFFCHAKLFFWSCWTRFSISLKRFRTKFGMTVCFAIPLQPLLSSRKVVLTVNSQDLSNPCDLSNYKLNVALMFLQEKLSTKIITYPVKTVGLNKSVWLHFSYISLKYYIFT